ncbi:hypothetical protein ACFX16_030854 [Malus domestica]
MAGAEVEELVVHLEKSMDLSNMEQGIKLVGTILAKKILNKWGTCNILTASSKKMGYREWTKTTPVKDFIEPLKPLAITMAEHRHAGATRQQKKEKNLKTWGRMSRTRDGLTFNHAQWIMEGNGPMALHSLPTQVQPSSMENFEEIGYTESCAKGSKSTKKRVLEASTKEVVVAGLQQP